jgi:hypothetical protein
MGRAKNTLKGSEVSSTPIKFRYAVTYASSSFSDYGITVNSGSNIAYDVNMTSAEMQSMNNYRVVRQLYYQQAISASLNTASFWDPVWQSTAASGTYDATYYDFPRDTTGSILIFAIPSSQFGEQISRKTFTIASTGGSQYRIEDDGNGNLVDRLNSDVKVGNIFYAQGIAVITKADYVIIPAAVDNLSTQADEPLITQASENIII